MVAFPWHCLSQDTGLDWRWIGLIITVPQVNGCHQKDWLGDLEENVEQQ
jgi:hypothetical protein